MLLDISSTKSIAVQHGRQDHMKSDHEMLYSLCILYALCQFVSYGAGFDTCFRLMSDDKLKDTVFYEVIGW